MHVVTMEVDFHSEIEFRTPLAIVGFPTVGLSGVIASQFLVEKLGLELVASLRSRRLPPATVVRRGDWEPPVAVYGKTLACGPGAHCESLLVATSSVPLEREAFWDVGEALMDFFIRNQVELTIVLESQAVEEETDPADVFTLSHGPAAKKTARQLGLPSLQDAIISGVSGSLLVEARRKQQDVLVLVTEAHEGHPDSRSAASLLKVLDESFVKVKMDLGPLIEHTTRIEDKIVRNQRQSKLAEQLSRESLAQMYR